LGEQRTIIEYSPYGSKLKEGMDYGFGVFYDRNDKETIKERKKNLEEQIEIKNSPNFYQQAPFLSIAEDLLKLIKEDKVEQLIFLSAYDKRKFPKGDERKLKIFRETFAKLDKDYERGVDVSLQLIGFDNETQGQTKAE
jgi:hypothetical protein